MRVSENKNMKARVMSQARFWVLSGQKRVSESRF